MVDLSYEFELPHEPLNGAALDEAKFAELSEVLQAALEKFRSATYAILVEHGLGLPGTDILTKLREDHKLDAKKLYEALETLTIDRLMNQPVMRRHFKLTTIDWFGLEKHVWTAVPTDENRATIEKNATAIVELERNKREAEKQRREWFNRRRPAHERRRPLQMNNRGPPRTAIRRPPSRQRPSRTVPVHSSSTRTAYTPTSSTAQPGRSLTTDARTNSQAVSVPAATRARLEQETIHAAAAVEEVHPDPHQPDASTTVAPNATRRVRFGGIEVVTLEPADAEPAEPQPEVTDDYIKSLVETKVSEVKPNCLHLEELAARLDRINPAIKNFISLEVALLRTYLEQKCTSFVDIAAVDDDVFAFYKQPSS